MPYISYSKIHRGDLIGRCALVFIIYGSVLYCPCTLLVLYGTVRKRYRYRYSPTASQIEATQSIIYYPTKRRTDYVQHFARSSMISPRCRFFAYGRTFRRIGNAPLRNQLRCVWTLKEVAPPDVNGDNDDTNNELQQQSVRPTTTTDSRTRDPAAPGGGKPVAAQLPPSSSILPGIGLSAVTAMGGFSLASALTTAMAAPLSGIPVSILLGFTIKNAVGYNNDTFKPGIVYSTKTILQGGIVCVAAKLSFLEMLSTGTAGIPVVLSSVGAGLLFIPFAGRLAGLPKEMSLLLTAGTSICGVTAITALAPAIQAPNRDIAVAVANTVAFGTIGMLTYPYLFHALCSSSEQVGMCLGIAIHDTSQVLGSALLYRDTFGDEVAFKVAAVTKLMRNLGLAVAIPLLTYQHTSSLACDNTSKNKTAIYKKQEETRSGLIVFTKYVPPFLIAFVGMTAFRSVGDFFLQDTVMAYSQTMDFLGNDLSKYALGTAMAGVGLSTDKSSLQGVGWKPFAVGLSGALVVGGTGFTVAMMTV